MSEVREYRKQQGDAYHFNWTLLIEPEFQLPFEPTHDNMANLNLEANQPTEQLAANLRRVFSGIVAGNVKDQAIRSIKQHGVFTLTGDQLLMEKVDKLLSAFVQQGRMKLPGSTYYPCYRIET